MIYDCFISYQNRDLRLVEAIAAELESRGLVCWYAPRNVSGRYAKAITDAINHSRVFLLILNSRSAVSDEVLNEVEIAHNVCKAGPYASIQPVCTEDMDFNDSSYQEMMYYIRRIRFVQSSPDTGMAELADEIMSAQPRLREKASSRSGSAYVVQDAEDERIRVQNELLDGFDRDVYTSVFHDYSAPRILDVGCGLGDMLMSRLEGVAYSAFMGIDRSERQIARATEKYGAENVRFLTADVESEELESRLRGEMQAAGIEKFDVINVSMLLLHLKEPLPLLSLLRELLDRRGTLIVRDIDDGINFAWPDPQNAFERIYKMCDRDEQSGNRRTGRQIHSYLIRAGFSHVSLERQGLSSAGMDSAHKEALFRMYFPFILYNAETMSNKYPKKRECADDLLWYRERFDSIHEEFMKPDFVFSLGFQTYTAAP